MTNGDTNATDIRIIQPFKVYGSKPYWVKDSVFTLPSNSSKIVFVYCKISHNTLNPANLIIISNQNRAGDNFIRLSCQGKYTKSYYNTTQDLSEEALKQALKTKLNLGTLSLSYNNARDKMYGKIDNKNDSVTCIYTNRKAKFNTRSGASASDFNCEHTFPQGQFGSGSPMVSDIHHLFSSDEPANGSRGNLRFGYAGMPIDAITINAPSKRGGGVYEPQDSHKGNCARAMMYFVLRYQDYMGFYAGGGQDTTFRKWNSSFLPKPKDTLRNTMIFVEQNNRNPFVDYPQFSERIKNLIGLSKSDSIQTLKASKNAIEYLKPNEEKSIVIWNEGNKKIKISSIRLALNTATFTGNSNLKSILDYNESSKISFSISPPLPIENDTLLVESNVSGMSVLKIPIIFRPTSNIGNVVKITPGVYPNPGSGNVFINKLGEVNGMIKIVISNIQGQKLKEICSEVQDGKSSFSVAELAQGLYIITLKGKETFYHFNFAKH